MYKMYPEYKLFGNPHVVTWLSCNLTHKFITLNSHLWIHVYHCEREKWIAGTPDVILMDINISESIKYKGVPFLHLAHNVCKNNFCEDGTNRSV